MHGGGDFLLSKYSMLYVIYMIYMIYMRDKEYLNYLVIFPNKARKRLC